MSSDRMITKDIDRCKENQEKRSASSMNVRERYKALT